MRHGETDWNRDRRYQGHADPPLNEAGRAQARQLAGALEDAGAGRDLHERPPASCETAEIIRAGRDIPLRREPGLREIDVGSWSGLTRAEIEERFPGAAEHDGESRDAMLRPRRERRSTAIAARHEGDAS